MVGRAIGSILLARVSAARLLALSTAIAAMLCLYVVTVGGATAGFVALSIGLFNSIMFPVIFTLTLERAGARAEATSGLLCRSEEHTSELQSLMRISYAVFCLKKKNTLVSNTDYIY